MGFPEFRQEPGVCSRVTAGMSIRNSRLFIEVRNLSRYEGHRYPDFTEQTPVSNGHPRHNSSMYPRGLPQLEKTNKTFPSPRDEARFPSIVSRAIVISQSNTFGA